MTMKMRMSLFWTHRLVQVQDLRQDGAGASPSPIHQFLPKEDTVANARRWVQETLVVVAGDSVRKSEVYARYCEYVAESGMGGVSAATLGKIIKEVFGVATKRLGPSGDQHYFYMRIKFNFPQQLLQIPANLPQPLQQQVMPLQRDWGTLLSSLKPSIPTFKKVPKGARLNVASALTTLIMTAKESNKDEDWAKLFLFSYKSLPVPKKEDRVKKLTKWVKDRVSDFVRDTTINAVQQKIEKNLQQQNQRRWRPSYQMAASEVLFAF
jgi:RFX DNA-binding domain-containing protein